MDAPVSQMLPVHVALFENELPDVDRSWLGHHELHDFDIDIGLDIGCNIGLDIDHDIGRY